MPIHDWARVGAGTFHDFHQAWLTHIKEALNEGVLPSNYYAQSEQVVSRRQTDVLALQATPTPPAPTPSTPALAVLDVAPPLVRLRLRPAARTQPTRRRMRRVTIRHSSDHRVVAVIEVASPANKDSRDSVRELVEKVCQLLEAGIHVLLVDLLPPRKHDPQGMHAAVWRVFDPAGYQPPDNEPFTLSSYRWDGAQPEVFLEPVGLGALLIDMPLFLERDRYVNVPLERTYAEAYRGVPAFWRNVIEGREARPP
jgi:hypothetical protein